MARDAAGESTDFRGGPDAEPVRDSGQSTRVPPGRPKSDTFVGQKSVRIKYTKSRAGLAVRLALPVLAATIAGLIILALVVRDRLSVLQLNDLRSDATYIAFHTGTLGRFLIYHQQKFLEEHPEYLEMAEWPAGDHWLVTHGFVSQDEWVEATGFQLDEYAPASIMERAAERIILQDYDRFLNSTRTRTEMVAAFLLTPSGAVMAQSRNATFRFDYLALKSVPLTVDPVVVNNIHIYVDVVTSIPPEPVVRAVARIYANDNPEILLGSSVAVLRTHRHSVEQNAFMLSLAGLGLLLAVLIAIASWYSARRIIAPMRRLAADMQAMAEGDFNRRATGKDGYEIDLLARAFNSMAERVRVARLNERKTSRLESDLAVAREIQNNLLPLQTPRVRGLDMHTIYRPARKIGGDYFDFLPVDDRHVGLVVADASGKSIPAALVMSTTRAILRFVAPGAESAAETLSRVNAILSVDIPKGMFVTAYYVILDPLAQTMLCASAGHTPMLIARADGGVDIVNPGGIALGFDRGAIFERSIREERIKLGRGDRVFLYTDGVVECMNAAEEEYSDRRLREFLRRNRDLSSHDFVGALMADLDRHRGTADMWDDITIVTFKVL